jgi:hypothetical protein
MNIEMDIMPLAIVSLISSDNNTCPLEIEQNLKHLRALKELVKDDNEFYLEKIGQGIEILEREKTNFSSY